MDKSTKEFLILIPIVFLLIVGVLKATKYSYISDKDYIKTITVNNTDYDFYLDNKNYLLVYQNKTFNYKLHNFALISDCKTLKFRINKITSQIKSKHTQRKKLLECVK